MIGIPSQLSLHVNDKIFLKHPESSSLGRKIVSSSIVLIDEIGFEDFTFRKLAEQIGSTEASIYRYFENKHRLLIYLLMIYWGRMEVALVYLTANLTDSREKLRRAIHLVTGATESGSPNSDAEEDCLQRIVITESSKTYLTKAVDIENEEGFFGPYKQLVEQIANIIAEINPDYKYPHMLVSTVIEGAHHQRFFADHLPRLTDRLNGEDSIALFYKELVFHALIPTHEFE